MRIDDPVSLAGRAKTDLQAARALAAIEAELSLGERSEHWYAEADDALAQLHSRWPRAHLLDAYRQPPTLSPRARRAGRADADPRPVLAQNRGGGVVERRWPRAAALALMCAAIGVAAALVVRHLRRHPSHGGVLAVAISALAIGRPSLLGPIAVLAGIERILRTRSVPAHRTRRHPMRLPRIRAVAPRAPRWRL